jgi:hypothetical protein
MNIDVLGPTRFSQYNFPGEPTCSGGADIPVYVLDTVTPCSWSVQMVNSIFRRQLNINGSGTTKTGVKLQRYSSTTKSCPLPIGGNLGLPNLIPNNGKDNNSANLFLMVSEFQGRCQSDLTSGKTLATYPFPARLPLAPSATPPFACSDKVLVLDPNSGQNSWIGSVQDACPHCADNTDFRGQAAHIDSFTFKSSLPWRTRSCARFRNQCQVKL